MAIISTGQFTIVDQNDAKPITAVISASTLTQQSFSQDNGILVYSPDWSLTNLVLTPRVYVGTVDVLAGSSVSAKNWSNTYDGTELGATNTLTVNTNFTTPDTVASKVYYFKCVYTDPTTLVAARVDASITLSVVKVGSNATYVTVQGNNIIKGSSTANKNVAVVKADLNRSSGIDVDGLQYRWYSVASNGTATHLYGVLPNYGFKKTASGVSPSGSYTDLNVNASGASTNLAWTTAEAVATTVATTATSGNGTTVTITTATQSPPITVGSYVVVSGVAPEAYNGTWLVTACTTTTVQFASTTTGAQTRAGTVKSATPGYNTLVISESAVVDYQVYKVEVKDNTSTTIYTQQFTINDQTDPYSVSIISSGGDRLLQGKGSTNLTPKVLSGIAEIVYTGWTFNWYLSLAKDTASIPKRCGFVESASPFSRGIVSNTAGVLTLSAAVSAAEMPEGSFIKMVSADGNTIKFCEVSVGTATTTLTLRTTTNATYPNDNTLCNPVLPTSLTVNEFASGTMFKCVAGKVTTAQNTLTLTEYDVDSKNIVTVDANKPI